MLEKVGLPAKPSLRGNNWVVDASHCQGCSSQFTFINRKHHCRRCGGLFCGSCTQHRMVLRGQGDSPVRICEPCKKMEEAARFELRHGNRSKAGKGSSKVASRDVDDVLNQLMANDSKDSNHTGFGKEISSQNEDEVLSGSSSNGFDMGSITPEELRQQSVDEKNRFKILKGEGKSAEALKAYKRSKELERQAAALELQLRKNRKKALASGSASSSMAERQKSGDVSLESSIKVKPGNQKVKEKDDLTAELKELGWSDVDINDVDKKPAVTSLEGELLNLIGKDSRKDGSSKVSSGLDKSQVVAMKKKALALKREGKLAEAKEELKRAKILEKQLEEQELLADAEDSDDELSALIRSMDEHDDKQNDFSVGFDLGSGFDFDLSKIGGDFNLDGNFEVTDDDLHDPEMAAALQSLGWDEDPMELDGKAPDSATVDGETVEAEILSLKKEAVTQKRAGNMAEAMSLLKKAKALEKDLDSSGSGNIENALGSDGVSTRTTADTVLTKTNLKPAPKSRLMIQKELLTVKKKALALRREGKLDEADEELKKGKVLEQQLEEIDNNASKMENLPFDLSSDVTPDDKEDEGDVITDQDLHDPTYLSLLKNLGWQEEDNNTKATIPSSEPSVGNPDTSSASTFTVKKLRRSKAEIQRELLGLKRKALALRRQGQETEAEELLVSAKALEEEMAEMEASKVEVFPNFSDQKLEFESNNPIEGVTQTPLKRPSESNNDDPEKRQVVNASTHELTPSPSVSPENQRIPLQQEILAHKRKALALKREGKMAEARAELRKAKLLERNLEENKPNNNNVTSISMDVTSSSPSSTSTPQEKKKPANSSPSKPMSSSERFKLQRECLNHKRNALKLRREGKTEEADSELEIAKKLEAQLDEASPQDSSSSTSSEAGLVEDSGVEDFLDPQLLSALKSIGLQDVAMVQQIPVKPETRAPSSTNKSDSSTQEERTQLEAQIKAEKVKALNLKRAGKQAEALDALHRAKQMEKKLNSMAM